MSYVGHAIFDSLVTASPRPLDLVWTGLTASRTAPSVGSCVCVATAWACPVDKAGALCCVPAGSKRAVKALCRPASSEVGSVYVDWQPAFTVVVDCRPPSSSCPSTLLIQLDLDLNRTLPSTCKSQLVYGYSKCQLLYVHFVSSTVDVLSGKIWNRTTNCKLVQCLFCLHPILSNR